MFDCNQIHISTDQLQYLFPHNKFSYLIQIFSTVVSFQVFQSNINKSYTLCAVVCVSGWSTCSFIFLYVQSSWLFSGTSLGILGCVDNSCRGGATWENLVWSCYKTRSCLDLKKQKERKEEKKKKRKLTLRVLNSKWKVSRSRMGSAQNFRLR